jgi:hypothetical protein
MSPSLMPGFSPCRARMYLMTIGGITACRYVPAEAFTRSPAALNMATIESPATPIDERDDRMKIS